ncbi:MAG: GNAT family N-acetyltransferase, partial [Myxococcota bacterium]
RGKSDAQLVSFVTERDLRAATELLAEEYWNVGVSEQALCESHLNASAWVGARDAQGRLIATARAVSDRSKHAWIYDVAVAGGWKGRGVGSDVMGLLLDHPAVRSARNVWLSTRDAQRFYHRFGFHETERVSSPGGPVSELMVLRQ